MLIIAEGTFGNIFKPVHIAWTNDCADAARKVDAYAVNHLYAFVFRTKSNFKIIVTVYCLRWTVNICAKWRMDFYFVVRINEHTNFSCFEL